MTRPRVGSICTGYGGLEIALQAVIPNTQLTWVADIDKGAQKVLTHHHPDIPNLGDITTVNWAQVDPVDILTGGTPCQDLSHAGKRAGMTTGSRSNLWVAMREAIATIRPTMVIWENVGGAYSAHADSDLEYVQGLLGDTPGRPALRALGRVLGDLATLGYDAEWHGLRASDIGAPHGRPRVFVAAHPAGYPWRFLDGDGSVAADADRAGGGRIQSRGVAPGPQEGTQSEAERSVGRGGSPYPRSALLPTPAVNDMGEGKTPEAWDTWTTRMQAAHDDGNGKSLAIEAQRLLPTPTNADSKASGAYGYGGNQFSTLTDATVRQQQHWGDYAAAITRWETLTHPAPPPTQPSRKGTPQLSPAFTEWMMGLPPGWITNTPHITRNEALRLAGNGVVPQQAAAALRTMLTRWAP